MSWVLPCAAFKSRAEAWSLVANPGALEVWGGGRAPRTVWSKMAARSRKSVKCTHLHICTKCTHYLDDNNYSNYWNQKWTKSQQSQTRFAERIEDSAEEWTRESNSRRPKFSESSEIVLGVLPEFTLGKFHDASGQRNFQVRTIR